MKLSAFLFFITATNLCFAMDESSNELIPFRNNDFKLEYPSSWTLDTSKAWGAELILFSPIENEADKFNENVNVVIQNLTDQNIDLEKYKQITDQQVADFATDGKILESSIVKTNERESFRITYTMTQGIFKLKITSVCLIHNDQAYLITFTAEVDQYDHYKVIGEKILSSFELASK